MANKKIFLSLIVPAYNEQDIIEKMIKEMLTFFKKQKYTWEIVLVSDGSTDKTVDIVSKLKDKHIRIIDLKENQGKGGALREGIMAANGKKILFTDADLSVPIKYTSNILKALETHDVAIGSRRIKGSIIKVHQPLIRESMGKVFTKLTQLVLLSTIADFTCGFKGFNKEAARKIFSNSQINRWAYDSEIIFLAKKYGFSIEQVPVEWVNRFESRVRIGSAAAKAFTDLMQIRINDLMGMYDK